MGDRLSLQHIKAESMLNCVVVDYFANIELVVIIAVIDD